MPSNAEIASVLQDLADLTVLDEGTSQSFRVRAYEAAAASVAAAAASVAEMEEGALTSLKGIGPATAAKIREYVETGHIARLDGLRRRFPPPFRELTRVPGIGPKTAVLLRDRLGVGSIEDLRDALTAERVRDLPGFGPKKESNLARALERVGTSGKDRRTPISVALRVATAVAETLEEMPGVVRAEPMGSIRRFRDTIADVDVMAATDGDPRVVVDHFASLPIASEVVSHGVGKSTIVSPDGLQIDLRVVEPGCWGSAAMYFTGSKAHNIRLRQIAIDSGRTLSEYGLADSATGAVVAAQTEEEVYRALGLDWVPPELREDRGEVELAAMGRLPELVEERHVRGDLHVHTDVSGDGRATLETMVAAAERRGYEYVAITDHGENLAINGASREELLEQRQAVARLQHRHPDLRILQGCELNIGRDGGVDYDAGFLAGLDFGVAAVHGAFDLDEETQTRRVISAMENPAVNVIGHLTGRQIGRRPGIDLDLEAVFDAAERTGTALEVNCHLDRLDLSADALYLAREREVLFSIDTDAHDAAELDNLRWGVRTARRGWVERDRVVNTWPVGRFLEWVGAKRSG